MADDRLTNPDYVWNKLDYVHDAIVEASAGTGKTYALESIVLKLLCDADKRYDARSILLVTFTEKAAGELRDRIRRTLDEAGKLPPDFDEMTICTIHSFCRRLLSEYAFENGVPMQCEPAGDSQELAHRAVREALKDARFEAACPDGLLKALEGANLESVGQLASKVEELVWKGRVERLRSDLHAPETKALATLAKAIGSCDPALKHVAKRAEFKTGTKTGGASKAFFGWFGESFELLGAPEEPGLADCLARFSAVADAGNPDLNPVIVSWDGQSVKKGRLSDIPGMAGCETTLKPLLKAVKALVDARRKLAGGENQGIRRSKLLLALADLAVPTFETLKKSAALLTFDDMVAKAADVVTRELSTDAERNARDRLFDSIRTSYRVALVDEFQDTDERQWDIFRTLFAAAGNKVEGGKPGFLVVVGDPKQAIYAFRGADVRVYCKARDAIADAAGAGPRNTQTLDETRRATPALVDAFNKLFGDEWFADGAAGEGIGYKPVGYPKNGNPRFGDRTPDGSEGLVEREAAPVLLLESMPRRADPAVNKNGGVSFGSAAACLPVFLDHAAAEMKHLVGLDWAWKRFDRDTGAWQEKRFRYDDMCVLVKTNDDASAARRILARHGIPCGQYKQRGLFDSPEAEGVLALFDFLARPAGRGNRQALLLSPLFGVHPSKLAAAGGADFDAFVERLQIHARKREWSELFETVMSDPCTALSSPGTDTIAFNRTRAAVRQLFDRLLAVRGRLAATVDDFADALRAWRRNDKLAGEEASLFGRESDADRVQIMTMHAAKGLEFPVVFVAAGFSQPGVKGVPDEERPALREEFRRLFYVALTRAMFRIYLPWSERAWTWKATVEEKKKDADGKEIKGPDGKAVKVPVERDFAGLGGVDSPLLVRPNGNTGFLGRAIKAYFDGRQGGSFPQKRFAQTAMPPPAAPPADSAGMQAADAGIPLAGVPKDLQWYANLTLQWDSFSSLKNSSAKDNPSSEKKKKTRPEVEQKDGAATDETHTETKPEANLPKSLLPGGRTSGNAFHEIMEELCGNDSENGDAVDFGNACDADMAKDDSPLMAVIRRRMRKHSIRNRTEGGEADADSTERTLLRMVQRALDTAIDVDGAPFKLRDIPRKDRLAETEFRGAEATLLRGIPAWREGVLNGAIDLLVRIGGKVYIVDWKTNSLPDYGPAAVEAKMDEEGYRRQYRLYALAADAWLAGHGLELAGAAYLFVRGGERGAASAVYSEAFDAGSIDRFRAEISSIPALGADKEESK